MRFTFSLILAVLSFAARADGLARVFPHLSRIRYDGQCLTIDDEDVFIFSGSFHYFRCPKELWPDRFRKIKAAGCNAVETYVPWNWHERNRPSSLTDYSQVDLQDLKDWLHMAQDEFGLYTIVRPGPYICAEWDGGGFPRWLLTERGAVREGADALRLRPGLGAPAGAGAPWLRTGDPTYLAWAKHWMDAVCPVIAAEQVTRKARGQRGVILVQIENEYDDCKGVSEAERVAQLRTLYQAAVAGGIDVPIFTCRTRQCRDSDDPLLSQVFDAVNLYPRFDLDSSARMIADLESAQPDAPAMVSELQGGWFSKVGGRLAEDQPGLTPEQLNAHLLLAVENGATIINCYMAFGGTNFGLWGSRGQTTTYDYDAPIREPGGVGPKYLALAEVGRMLRANGAALARSRPITCQVETASPDVTVMARLTRDNSIYLFFRNRSLAARQRGVAVIWLEKSGEIEVNYDLGPFGFNVLYMAPGARWPFDSGQSVPGPRTPEGRPRRMPSGVVWLPQPIAGPDRPARVPDPVRPAGAQTRTDSGGSDWAAVPAGALLPELGVWDARPVVYQAQVNLTADQAAEIDALELSGYPGDGMAVQVNGHPVADVIAGGAAIAGWLHAGDNTLAVLYNQAGQAKIGRAIDDEAGLRSAQLASRHPGFATPIPVSGWRVGRALTGVAERWFAAPPGMLPGWNMVELDARRPVAGQGTLADVAAGPADALATWYRVEFQLPAPEPGVWVPWRARIDAAGDGLVYLNGRALGRYWEAGPQREYYLPECWLNFGAGRANVLTLCLSPMKKGVGLRAVEVSPYAEQAEVIK